MDAKAFAEDLIKTLAIAQNEASNKMAALTINEPEWDAWYQIHKDLGKYIVDQNHTIGLIEDGLI